MAIGSDHWFQHPWKIGQSFRPWLRRAKWWGRKIRVIRPHFTSATFFFITLTVKTSETSFMADWEKWRDAETLCSLVWNLFPARLAAYIIIIFIYFFFFYRDFFFSPSGGGECVSAQEGSWWERLSEKPCGQDKSRLACNLLCIFCVPLGGLRCRRKIRQQDNRKSLFFFAWLFKRKKNIFLFFLECFFLLHKRC